MADPATIISGLLSNLAPLIKDEFSLFWNFKKDVENLSSTLSAINAALEDAEIKDVWKKDSQTEDWLRKLKDVAYKVRDIMDECTFEDLRHQVKRLNASSSTRIQVTNFLTRPFSSTWSIHKIGFKIKDVQEKLDKIHSENNKYQLREPIHGSKIKEDKFSSSWRETMSLSSSPVLYGRGKEKKQIIDILLNNNTSTSTVSVATKQLSVLPIVGIGGLGKTTLAQMVFNDREVSDHFDPKFWVCVSDEFDIKLVIKSILQEKTEASLEELQKNVRDKLREKRYLIVLDDVWNEDIHEWNQLRSILDCGSNDAFVLTTTRKLNVAEIMKTVKPFELQPLTYTYCWQLFKERAFGYGKPKDPNFINIGEQITIRCKGVPLVAKTLGSHLGFCEDEKEWHRIRDSELWDISENGKDLLPILRLSYYDLSYQLRRCFAFCAIFPKDTLIRKEKLIQLWMAHGLILPDTNQEVEDAGNRIWKELCWRSFFQDEKENKDEYNRVYTTCMIHDLMHDLAQSVMKEECYTMKANSSSDGLEREIHRHVTVDKFNEPNFCSLKEIRGSHSIMVVNCGDYDGIVAREILNVLKELLPLRVLEVRWYVQYQDLSYVSRLKHLRYLDISKSKITTLHDSICELFNLQTLKLNSCSMLESLPRNMRNLVNLRHLYLEDCDGLKYMPRGMGQLKHLKTLSLVSDASIARGINIAKWSSITTLELDWGFNADADGHEKIGEALEVSTTRLKTLRMNVYKGVNPPKWVGKSSPSVLFPLLERLTVSFMMNLRELVSPNTIPSTGAFPNLCSLRISYCPKLGALPVPHLKSLKYVSVYDECSDELLYSISHLSALTHLYLYGLNKRSVLFPSSIFADNNEAQLGGVRSTFQSLQSLSIENCENLRRLFDEGMIMEEETHHDHHFQAGQTERTRGLMNSLTELDISDCWELMISVEEFGNLNSLQRLRIMDCPKLVSSEEEAGDFKALLRSLRTRLGSKKLRVDIELEKEGRGRAYQSIVAPS
ncbi:putative disease resistance protein RGA4 [Impatiens glandulifera]|uniref:putative disease resistance protein RGA4 n=1 Tax=Impatiens glandulifera TaxID=253017 RepID=UPI001FB13A82|nr:putative disease resistance protein RGA4 [Impatiens glandulifera]